MSRTGQVPTGRQHRMKVADGHCLPWPAHAYETTLPRIQGGVSDSASAGVCRAPHNAKYGREPSSCSGPSEPSLKVTCNSCMVQHKSLLSRFFEALRFTYISEGIQVCLKWSFLPGGGLEGASVHAFRHNRFLTCQLQGQSVWSVYIQHCSPRSRSQMPDGSQPCCCNQVPCSPPEEQVERCATLPVMIYLSESKTGFTTQCVGCQQGLAGGSIGLDWCLRSQYVVY